MADLDNFFAKKDKKKGTKKKGFSKANTDVLAKNLEEKELRDLKAEEKATPLATSEATKLAFEDNPVSGVHGPKGQSNGARASTGAEASSSVAEEGGAAGAGAKTSSKYFGVISHEANDDEWLDYENEKKDYSGLKIENLKVKEGEEEEEEHEINEETGEKIPIKKDGNVWSKGGGNQQHKDRSESPEPKDDDARSTASSNNENNSGNASSTAAAAADAGGPPKSSYVPPHLRGVNRDREERSSGTGAGGPSLAPVRLGGGGGGGRRLRAAPDINSEVYFPSLGEAPPPGSEKGGHDFEQVRSGGGGSKSSAAGAAPRLALGNKFDALRD